MRNEREVPRSEKEVKKQGALVVIAGPTGVGKDTVMKELLESDEGFEKLVTLASRSPRYWQGEIRGWDYHFVGRRAFEWMIADGDFLEWVNYGENEEKPDYKGTLKQSILSVLDGRRVIWRIDMSAAANVHEILQEKLSEEEYEAVKDRVVVILVGVKSLFDLRARLVKREGKGYDRERFLDRMRVDWKVWETYDFENIVFNEAEKVDEAVREIIGLVNKVELGDA